jgi:hypothetical protein
MYGAQNSLTLTYFTEFQHPLHTHQFLLAASHLSSHFCSQSLMPFLPLWIPRDSLSILDLLCRYFSQFEGVIETRFKFPLVSLAGC